MYKKIFFTIALPLPSSYTKALAEDEAPAVADRFGADAWNVTSAKGGWELELYYDRETDAAQASEDILLALVN